MNDADLSEAIRALANARRDGQRLAELPPAWVPGDLASAYAMQRGVAGSLGEVRGWKVGAVTAVQREAMGVPSPVGGPLLAPWTRQSPARFRSAEFVAPRLECEFAFELGKDLPARPGRYAREEVEAAIAAVRIGFEIVDSRLPPQSGFLSELADGFNNGGYVIGPSATALADVDLADHEIVLTARTGGAPRELARGTGRAILNGDLLAAVVMLANAPPHGSAGLRAGQIVTTGSCTGAVALPGACTVTADFGRLGRIEVQFD